MKRIDFATFVERASEFDSAVHAEAEIATFCSTSVWQTAAFRSLHGGSDESNFLILEEDDTWLVLVERNENVFYPLEAAWMFGCPFIGDPDKLESVLQKVVTEFQGLPTGFVIPGVRKDGVLHQKLKQLEETALRYEEFPATDCMSIDLSSGFEPWLARRSAKFRKSIRQLRLPDDFEIVDASGDDPEVLMKRIIAIQQQTYKWREGTDIFQGDEYVKFYGDILGQLSSRGSVRLLFGQVEGNDAAYIFGGISDSVYRGFQMSYAQEFAKYGIGNHLQIENIKRMASEGIAEYDLGMHSEYKERWADQQDQYIGVFLIIE